MTEISEASAKIELARLRWLAIARVLLYVAPLAVVAAFAVLHFAGLLPRWVEPEWMVWIGLAFSFMGVVASQMALRQVRRQIKQMTAEQLDRITVRDQDAAARADAYAGKP